MENDKLKSYQPFHIQYVNYTWALIKTIKNNQTVYMMNFFYVNHWEKYIDYCAS